METEYDLYSEFDIAKHKKKYYAYLEVIIDKFGNIMYAIPSHQEKALELAAEYLGITKKEVSDKCPSSMYFDYFTWLLSLTGSIAVWYDNIYAPNINTKQICSLLKLKNEGLYKGKIPKIPRKE